ncbi:type III PLP-dependent enzyme domain-containing protein [Mycobacterium camsae]|uniref:hypothetical protein n=1 Tax=Mycobacterium gordonae TaxID=1778 RepID=UPI003D6631C3
MTLLHMLPSVGRAAPICDEADFHHRAHRDHKALRHVEMVYAGKSLAARAVARWVRQHGLGVDVCSAGELALAFSGGIDPARVIVHVNAMSLHELGGVVAAGVGRIVVDDPFEVNYLANLVRYQRVLIQVIPDVDIHGHRGGEISDQEFGFTVGGDHAADAVRWVLAHRTLDLVGMHCHIADPVLCGEAIRRMIAAMADVRTHHGVILTELSLGLPSCGDPRELAAVIEDAVDEGCAAEHFPRPAVVVEIPAGDYQGIVAQE